jgi:hypothetical protein
MSIELTKLNGQVTVSIFKKVESEHVDMYGTHKAVEWVEDHKENVQYKVEIRDTLDIISLAHRAARNKNGKAVSGPIRVTVTKRQYVD